MNATRIEKRLRSTSPFRGRGSEYLYVIKSPTVRGVMIYTKGKIVVDGEVETYYLLVSAKRTD